MTGLHVIDTPTGRFVIVGRVPPALAFVWDDWRDVETALHCGSGLARRAAERAGRAFATRTWDTREAAQAAVDEWKAANAAVCDECGAAISDDEPSMISASHGEGCSLNPRNGA